MKITGFTIIRNAVMNDYPVVESITSILPVVDEMIVLVGESQDETENLVRGINSPKIKIHHSVWDPSLTEGGAVLAAETDKAFELVAPDSDWAFYIQADEVVHEKYHDAIRRAAEQYKDDKRVDGLLFKYLHFYGTYDYVGDSRRWYHREVRIIRNDKSISSYKDAQGFRRNGRPINVKLIPAYIYHYGWVKNPKKMQEKRRNMIDLWQNKTGENEEIVKVDIFDFNEDIDSVKKFEGTHPAVMQKRIAEQNWTVELDIDKKKFSLKDRLLYWYEKKTGVRLFDFKNYRII
jgi:hypothetical protein